MRIPSKSSPETKDRQTHRQQGFTHLIDISCRNKGQTNTQTTEFYSLERYFMQEHAEKGPDIYLPLKTAQI